MNTIFQGFAAAYAGMDSGHYHAACFINGHAVACGRGFFWGAVVLGPVAFCLTFIASVLTIAGLWAIFRKAGKPGWAALVPIYNLVVLLEVVKRPIWWIFFYFIPFVNIIVALIVIFELAHAFGKGIGTILGLIFLPFVFYPLLGFGKTPYHHPAHHRASPVPPAK